ESNCADVTVNCAMGGRNKPSPCVVPAPNRRPGWRRCVSRVAGAPGVDTWARPLMGERIADIGLKLKPLLLIVSNQSAANRSESVARVAHYPRQSTHENMEPSKLARVRLWRPINQ